jgi:NitT/TauT family transport system ATP-binding protein
VKAFSDDAPESVRSSADVAVIEVEHVHKEFQMSRYETFVALADVSLRIQSGRFTCFVGPSGCGKTTLLNMIAGLIRPTSGRILYEGHEVRGINSRAGYITQRDNLLPWRTLERNVGFALEVQHVPRRKRRERVAQILNRVGLNGFEDLYPSQLSGGMRKRATLARTLIYHPKTLLMDEPFAAVDAILRMSLHEMLMRLWQAEGISVIFVTHDIEEALLLGDEIVVFGKNPGRILHVQEVPFVRPRNVLELRADPAFGQMWRMLWDRMAEGHSAELLESSGLPAARHSG